jgi:hypothetical protein
MLSHKRNDEAVQIRPHVLRERIIQSNAVLQEGRLGWTLNQQ